MNTMDSIMLRTAAGTEVRVRFGAVPSNDHRATSDAETPSSNVIMDWSNGQSAAEGVEACSASGRGGAVRCGANQASHSEHVQR